MNQPYTYISFPVAILLLNFFVQLATSSTSFITSEKRAKSHFLSKRSTERRSEFEQNCYEPDELCDFEEFAEYAENIYGKVVFGKYDGQLFGMRATKKIPRTMLAYRKMYKKCPDFKRSDCSKMLDEYRDSIISVHHYFSAKTC